MNQNKKRKKQKVWHSINISTIFYNIDYLSFMTDEICENARNPLLVNKVRNTIEIRKYMFLWQWTRVELLNRNFSNISDFSNFRTFQNSFNILSFFLCRLHRKVCMHFCVHLFFKSFSNKLFRTKRFRIFVSIFSPKLVGRKWPSKTEQSRRVVPPLSLYNIGFIQKVAASWSSGSF
jgi:hypothetical protein